MPQLQLPVFPAGTREINRDVGVQCEQGKVVCLHGHLPVFQHEEKDLRSFRLITSQMVVSGVVRAREVGEAFGVPLGTVKRYVGLLRRTGPAGFYQSGARQHSETKRTGEIKEKARELLSAGHTVAEVGRETGVLATTPPSANGYPGPRDPARARHPSLGRAANSRPTRLPDEVAS